MMEEDVAKVAGPKGKHNPERKAYRHGFEPTRVIIAGVSAPVARPRARTLSGQEVEIKSYELARRGDLLCEAALNRMLHGLSSRNYNYGSENPGSQWSAKSTVSWRFVRASEAELKKLIKRQVPEVVVLYIDVVVYAEHSVIVAMGLDSEGIKHILGFKIRATENAQVCQDLLVDLCERGLHAESGLLAVIDGSKALNGESGPLELFGDINSNN